MRGGAGSAAAAGHAGRRGSHGSGGLIRACWQEGRLEGMGKIQYPGKVGFGILGGFAKGTDSNQVENHFTDILTAADPPGIEDGERERAEFAQGEVAEAGEQFLAADMPAFAGRATRGKGEVQCLAQKMIRVRIKFLIQRGRLHGIFIKSLLLHGEWPARDDFPWQV